MLWVLHKTKSDVDSIRSSRYILKRIHTSPDRKTTQISINRYVGKEGMVYTHSGILFSLHKEPDPVIYDNMDKTRRHYAKCNKPVTEGPIICDSIHVRYLDLVKLTEAENTVQLPYNVEGEMGSIFHGYNIC